MRVFAQELLALAKVIASLEGASAYQVNLRRAVSTAYYALFHFLIAEATAVWSHQETRAVLGRVFDHGRMKSLCEKTLSSVKRIPPFEARTVDDHLCAVARQFIEAQEAREDADYDAASEWSSTAVREHIENIEDAIRSWEAIRDEPAARHFLVQLFGPRQRRR